MTVPAQTDFARKHRELADRGVRNVAVLRAPKQNVPYRRRDSETGAYCIPRTFTAFDLQWLEEQLRP